jgi:hypothetical protein
MAQINQRRAGCPRPSFPPSASERAADFTGKYKNPSKLMAKGAIRMGSRNALLPGKYNKAGNSI